MMVVSLPWLATKPRFRRLREAVAAQLPAEAASPGLRGIEPGNNAGFHQIPKSAVD